MWLIGGAAEARGEGTGRQGDEGATSDRMAAGAVAGRGMGRLEALQCGETVVKTEIGLLCGLTWTGWRRVEQGTGWVPVAAALLNRERSN